MKYLLFRCKAGKFHFTSCIAITVDNSKLSINYLTSGASWPSYLKNTSIYVILTIERRCCYERRI